MAVSGEAYAAFCHFLMPRPIYEETSMSTVCPKSAAQMISCGLKSIDNGFLHI